MNLYCECFGSGTPVLLIHGALSDHTFFSGVAHHLSKCCKVISYDRRGYGENPPVNQADCSLAVQADDACQVLSSFANEPACVVGHSLGANIALELAIQYPHLVKKLVLVEPSLRTNPEDAQKLTDWHNELMGCVKRKQLLRIFTSFQALTGAQRQDKPSDALKLDAAKINRMRKNLEAFARGDLPQMNAFVPNEAQIRNLSVPVTVAVTKQNNNVFFDTAIHDSACFGWPVVSFPGTHSSIEENSEPFARKLIEVLQV